ncbi:YdcF family protein [Clostridium senegalense]|uniref:YdcF family protein n=1 Tax=Clostridium senegalense TaxID=1465809 RepID=A0A6M0H0D7_9CLOT|nr:YdcF family protein [Clostridium senegalense]NEU04049.1 YdcF family protein [Clostridium senegalense]
MKKILFVLGVLCIGYFLCINIILGYITFSSFYLIIGIALILYGKFRGKIFFCNAKNKIQKVIKTVVIVCILIFMVTESYIILYPKKSIESCDYVIVLGAGIEGETLSTTLKDRLYATLDYIDKTNFQGIIVVSGGKGSKENISEAEGMKRYLVSKGIDNNRIVMENKSTNTYENFNYSRGVIENITGTEIGENDVTIVTTDFHGARSKMLANRNKYKNTRLYTSRTRWCLVPVMYAREFFAFGKSIVFDK